MEENLTEWNILKIQPWQLEKINEIQFCFLSHCFKFLPGVKIGLEGITSYRSTVLLLDASVHTGQTHPSTDDL